MTAPASSRRAFLLIQRMKQAASARFTLYRDKLQATRTHAIARLRLRRRFYRQKWSKTKRRVSIQIRILLFKGLGRAQLQSRIILTRGENYIATTASVLVAALFALTLPEAFLLPNGVLKTSEVHLASAGIIGTALALVLSLSIVPAQKAADVFSAAILKLYARDRTMLWVFALLSCAALLSLLLGTGWSFYLSARYTLAVQFILLGLSLDALKAFYIRALDLLVPATALTMVSKECERYIRGTRKQIERILRVHQITTGDADSNAGVRYLAYQKSNLPGALTGWTTQLEEFAHKGVARRDTQAVNAIMLTMATIGRNYAESRRDSMLLQPDFTGGFPSAESDIGRVLNPIYESIKSVCDDAAKQPNEPIVRGCILALADMAAHAMTMVHDRERGYRTVPLAHSPAFYLDVCVKTAIAAGMEDALLAAAGGVQKIFAHISAHTDSQSAEETTIDVLFHIAVASYAKLTIASCFQSVQMMMFAALHDIRVRGYRNHGTILSTVLPNIAALMPLEAAMDKAGKRLMQTFPPYSMAFDANIAALLSEVATQVKAVERNGRQLDPFHDFKEASEMVATHFREVAERVTFEGGLLQKWIVDALFRCVEVHIRLIDQPPKGAEAFTETVYKRLRPFIYVHARFVQGNASFEYRHASDACGDLSILGMSLIQRRHPKLAEECGAAIDAIAQSAAASKPSSYRVYGWADCMVKLEILRARQMLWATMRLPPCIGRAARGRNTSRSQTWPNTPTR